MWLRDKRLGWLEWREGWEVGSEFIGYKGWRCRDDSRWFVGVVDVV